MDRFAMGAKNLEGRSSPSVTHSATVVIEFTATLGVMSVRKELPVAPKALLGIHTVFGDGSAGARSIIWAGRTSDPVPF